MPREFSISGNIVDVVSRTIFRGQIVVEKGRIKSVKEGNATHDNYILPGLIDAHVHVESSMLIPSEFARLAVPHGTVATISDPHEIGNVLGIAGVRYMIENGKKVPFKFHFGAPSCVPATKFETAGAEIGVKEIETLMAMDEIHYLAEMMNYPGVLANDKTVMQKIAVARNSGKVIDGHAPGLRGEEARKYIEAGITTDHECFTREEALDKLKYGMKIQIREGSAAKNFDALIGLLDEYPDMMMFCSDDKHPNDLVKGHINLLVQRAVATGIDPMKAIRAATYNVVKHYGLNVGLLQEGDPADFIVVNDLKEFRVERTFVDGMKVAENGKTLIDPIDETVVNQFNCNEIGVEDISITADGETLNVIEVTDGQLITNHIKSQISGNGQFIVSDVEQDILKLVVVNRYHKAPPSVGFVKNFGFREGAIASSVAHDCHNIIAVGVDDNDIVKAINALIKCKGGVSLSNANEQLVLPLPVAGLMSVNNGYDVADQYDILDGKARELGSSLASPFMMLSFCALLVIPDLKLSDQGVFDGKKFQLIPLFS